jgi:hypothetical protein
MFISVMLSHGENPKRIAEYVGNSPEIIFRSYGKWIGGHEGFGKAALEATKTKPKPYQEVELTHTIWLAVLSWQVTCQRRISY